ncbi:MAG: ExbD/TolR family protein [Bacillota bacterium]
MFKPTLKKKSSINIIPMIDVIFFLLVFFMLFTSFRSTPEGLDMQLPKAVTTTQQSENNIIINVTEDGKYFYQNKNITLNNLSDTLKNEHENLGELTAIINADEEVKYRYVVEVMDNLRNSGVYKLALAAEPKGEEDEGE